MLSRSIHPIPPSKFFKCIFGSQDTYNVTKTKEFIHLYLMFDSPFSTITCVKSNVHN